MYVKKIKLLFIAADKRLTKVAQNFLHVTKIHCCYNYINYYFACSYIFDSPQ